MLRVHSRRVQIDGYPFQTLLPVKDKGAALLLRHAEARMASDRKIHPLFSRIFYLPFYCYTVSFYFMRNLQHKVKRIDFPAFFIGNQAVRHMGLSCLHTLKPSVSGKTMLAHRIFLSFICIEAAVYLSHKREQYRRVARPDFRICRPQSFPVFCLVINAAKLRSIITHLNFQFFIFQHPHLRHTCSSSCRFPPGTL